MLIETQIDKFLYLVFVTLEIASDLTKDLPMFLLVDRENPNSAMKKTLHTINICKIPKFYSVIKTCFNITPSIYGIWNKISPFKLKIMP